MLKRFRNSTGSAKLTDPVMIIIIIIISIFLAFLIGKGSFKTAIMLTVVPVALLYIGRLFDLPRTGLYTVLFLAFFAIGLIRYIPGVPLGLTIDSVLVLTWVAVFFRYFYEKVDIRVYKNDLNILMLVWFMYTVAQFFNPESLSRTAWFYAMRGLSLYPLLTVPLVFLLFNKIRSFHMFLYLWGIFSILGTLKGAMQLYIGPDFAEQRWLDTVGAITHILFGELRVFSFYSDAGQYGAAQAAAGVVGMIIALNVKDFKLRVFFWIVGLGGIWGMFNSGTRGAIIVPAIGAMVYLIHRKNIRVIIVGVIMLIGVYVFFKYTFIGQGIGQIRRMRTAFNPDEDASLIVRLENRKILSVYLANKPFGGGVGSAGDWGQRFSPQGFLANVATDSWYVQIWAEQGIVGLTLHLFILAYILVKASYFIMFKIQDPELRGMMSAITAAFAGVMGASYGNGVLGQMPTGMITYMSWAFLFMSPMFDRELTAAKLLKSKSS